ncbi:MAG TPA: chorismate mutase [Acidobacteriota bacterium]|nr:chorismate mutase [Acidobacteriota bacterium]
MIRGIRGAIQVSANESDAIVLAATELMQALIEPNQIKKEKVSAVFFTVTPDLNAAFPAAVRNKLGWDLVPFLCGQEIAVPNTLERVLRVLILFDTDRGQEQIRHQYLGETASLRPDFNDN